MFASERIRITKGILLDKKHINVSDLSSLLKVSEVTIRRDLEKLEGENFLTRTHGGAVLNETIPSSDRECQSVEFDPYYQEREEISDIAAHMIDDNDVIILSPGLTNISIAKKLINKKNLTVLTNDLNIASELSTVSGIKVIIPGGDLDVASMSVLGKLTEENIRSFYVSKAFIEVDGVSFERGYTISGLDKSSVIKEMLEITKERIIVCPHTCFDNIAFSQIGPLDLAQKIITNPLISDAYKKYYFESSVQLFTAFNAYTA